MQRLVISIQICLFAMYWVPNAGAQEISPETRQRLLREGLFLQSVPREDEYGGTPLDLDKPVVSRDMETVDRGVTSTYQQGLLAYFARDYASALSTWLPLADAGDSAAQSSVGWLYQQGLGVTIDLAVAAKWFERAAQQGHAVAQNNLGVCFEYGWGVKQDYALAAQWYLRAAQANDKFAQYNIGVLLWKGLGVAKNTSEARKWFEKSAAQGVTQAKDYIK